MSKRLKRKIQEVAGLETLKREEQLKLAQAILEDADAKQAICNKVLGVSHKDVEKALTSIIQDKRPTKSERDEKELRSLAPEKFHPERQQSYSSNGADMVELLDPAEARALVEESLTSKAIQEEVVPVDPTSYSTYHFEEVAALLANDYHPDHFKYLKN